VYVDANENGAQDQGEAGYQGTTITFSAVWYQITTGADGKYAFYLNPIDNFITVSVSVPPGYEATTTNPYQGWVNAGEGMTLIVNFGIAPVPYYSISGKIFNDVNGDEKSAGDANYTGNFTVSSTGGTVTYPQPAGNYLITSLPAGQYTITFSVSPTDNWGFTYPPYNVGCPLADKNCLGVKVGNACSAPGTSEAVCDEIGNISNLNAGVTSIKDPWFQSTGADIRWDSGFNNPLPSSDAYASVPGTGGTPGIIFSGRLTPNFGAGKASQNPFNWQVGNPAYPEVFTQTHSLIPTSYRFLAETAQSSGIIPTDLVDKCGAGGIYDCSLDVSLPHGIYKAEGNLTINANYTFGANQNFIILINGNLNIKGKITVPVGSTAIFSAKGNITVNKEIGETASTVCIAATHQGCSIEGLYSADGTFTADGTNSCPVIDKRLNIAGSVIANAGRGIWGPTGTFVNQRTLCAGNTANPSVSFIERPDFMLNYPSFVKQIPRFWREVAP
jgi:hypothetical protein